MGARRVSIASWNVNGIRARVERLSAFIERSGPDVLLLQETKCNPEQVPAELFEMRGYRWAAIGAGGRNGVLVASRIGLDAPVLGLRASAAAGASAVEEGDPDLSDEPRLIAARCAGILVASVYAALSVRRADDTVAMIVPPLAFLVAALTAGQINIGAVEGSLFNRAAVVFFTLAENWVWIIVATLAAAVIVLVRRKRG